MKACYYYLLQGLNILEHHPNYSPKRIKQKCLDVVIYYLDVLL